MIEDVGYEIGSYEKLTLEDRKYYLNAAKSLSYKEPQRYYKINTILSQFFSDFCRYITKKHLEIEYEYDVNVPELDIPIFFNNPGCQLLEYVEYFQYDNSFEFTLTNDDKHALDYKEEYDIEMKYETIESLLDEKFIISCILKSFQAELEKGESSRITYDKIVDYFLELENYK